jgi:hypothetical protein
MNRKFQAIEKWEDSWDTFFSHEFAARKRKLVDEQIKDKRGKIHTNYGNDKDDGFEEVHIQDIDNILNAVSSLDGIENGEQSSREAVQRDYYNLLTKYNKYINKYSYLTPSLISKQPLEPTTPESAGLPPRIFVPFNQHHAPLVPCNHQCQLIGFFDTWQLGYQVVYHHRHHRYLPTVKRPTEGLILYVNMYYLQKCTKLK